MQAIETALVEDQWPYVLSVLPEDLEQTAQETDAIVRRRVIKDARTLLRLLLAYGCCGFSARQTCAWAQANGVGGMSNVSLLERFDYSARWIESLAISMLREQCPAPEVVIPGHNVRVVDASCINRPGSHGTDVRMHLSMSLDGLGIDFFEITDAGGGETYRRFAVSPGDVLVADRGYAHRAGVASVVRSGGDVIVRLNWQNLPLLDESGKPFDVLGHLRQIKGTDVAEWKVQTAPDSEKGIGSIAGRLVAVRKSPQAAERDRKNVVAQAKKKRRKPDPRSIEAAGYVFVFTTLSSEEVWAEDVLKIYRFRWQIEILFKRLKGIMCLDEVPKCTDSLLRTLLLTKLLGALIVQKLARQAGAFSPWGY